MVKLIILLLFIIFFLLLKVIQARKHSSDMNHLSFEVKESILKGAGRGLFATKNYKEGDIIETCPMIKVDDINTDSSIKDYIFESHYGDKTLLSFGYCSLINHSEKRWNCTWKVSEDDNVIIMYAIKDIKVGDEFFSNYGEKYWEDRQDDPM